VIEIVAGNKEPVMSLSDLCSGTGDTFTLTYIQGHAPMSLYSLLATKESVQQILELAKRSILPSVELVLRGDAGSNVGDIDGATVHIIEVRIGNAVWLSALFL